MVTLSEIQQPIDGHLCKVEGELKKALGSATPALSDIHAHLSKAKGKRLRPTLALLFMAKGKKEGGHPSISTATALELIHIASLVHDDVMDGSSLRHGVASVNAKFGQNEAICSGDYLFAQALEMLARTRNAELVSLGAIAIQKLCEGQAAQIRTRGKLTLSKEEYTHICLMKTAALFMASCEMGAMHSGGDRLKAAEFGKHFGLAFQLVDDWLDVMSSKEKLGKAPGENIRAGELTMPIILLRDTLRGKERKSLDALLIRMDSSAFGKVKALLVEKRIELQVRVLLEGHIAKAKKALPKDAHPSLVGLLDLVMNRMDEFSVK